MRVVFTGQRAKTAHHKHPFLPIKQAVTFPLEIVYIKANRSPEALDPLEIDFEMTKKPDLSFLPRAMGLPGKPSDHTVLVAMSGGVDSSVVAALLADAGYKVIGATMQLYDHGEAIHRKGACCAGQDIYDAKRVADKIGIPHYVLDYESRFKDTVMEEFADSYLAGETPIPCVSCNQSVKFEDLLGLSRKLGARVMATGHYVQALQDGNRMALYRGADTSRDQSYFLFATTHDQLEDVRFPLGGLPKTKVRELAAYYGLAIADKPDSQDICFVPEGKYTDVIKKLRPKAVEPGEIVHMDGRVLGTHEGIIHYTVGQRRGLGIAAGEPLYVVRLDAVKAQVIVGPKEALATRTIHLRNINWLGTGSFAEAAQEGTELFVRVRSTRPPSPAELTMDNGKPAVRLMSGEAGVSPGQACVFYETDDPQSKVLGGGFIAMTDAGRTTVAAE